MSFKDLALAQRIAAVHFDIMRDPEFSLLGGVTQIGKVKLVSGAGVCPTAGTNGGDVFYNEDFIKDMDRQTLRYLVLHENLHKALHHCTAYKAVVEKHPQMSNMAMDYVINLMIEDMDAAMTRDKPFVARPTSTPPLIDARYRGMSFMEVLRDLIKNPPPEDSSIMDEHMQGEAGEDGAGKEATEAQVAALKQAITDAVNQGAIVQAKLRADKSDKSGKPTDLSGFQERRTNWREPLKRFVQAVCEGDEQSRWNPPNKRYLPLGIRMPSHYTETIGELVIACDTSGSMGGCYPTVFGEVARICKSVQPAKVRMIWWDTEVNSEQVFLPKDYDTIAKVMKPEGGGGTTVSCVAAYIAAKKYKPVAVIYLTDGLIEANYAVPKVPCLWGVVDNEAWTPSKGGVVRINSLAL
jgi:predicted metal-dependent peptidase